MPALAAGPAGRALPEGLVALARVPGFVFVSSDLGLAAGRYRLDLGFDRASFASALTNSASSGHAYPSGLVIELIHGSTTIGLRPIAIDELARGTLSVELQIAHTGSRTNTALRLFSSGKIGFAINSASLEQVVVPNASADIAEFNYVPMLAVGPAGARGPAPDGLGRAIHSQPGVAGWIAHCGDDHVRHPQPKRTYDGLFNCLWLPAGRYEASFQFAIQGVATGSAIGMYVVAEQGKIMLTKLFLEPERPGAIRTSLFFEIGEQMPVREDGLLEFLVWSGGRVEFSLDVLQIHEAPRNAQIFAGQSLAQGDLFAALSAGEAGMRLPGAIVSVAGVTGSVFSGTVPDMAPGSYRLSLDVGRAGFTRSSTNESGLGLAVLQGTRLSSYRELSREELERGGIAIEFQVPMTAAEDRTVEFRLWSIGLAEIEFCGARVEEAIASRSPEELVDFDVMLLLETGPAGEWVPAPVSNRTSIHAKAGEVGNVSNGPRVWLAAGSYEATFEFYVERGMENAVVSVDVVSNLGANVLAQDIFAPKGRGPLKRILGGRWERLEGTLPFKVPDTVPEGDNGRLEFRSWSAGGIEFFLVALRVKKL